MLLIQLSLKVNDDRANTLASIDEMLEVVTWRGRKTVTSASRAVIGHGETTNAAVLDWLRKELGIPADAVGPATRESIAAMAALHEAIDGPV